MFKERQFLTDKTAMAVRDEQPELFVFFPLKKYESMKAMTYFVFGRQTTQNQLQTSMANGCKAVFYLI